ncbi:hypothetical protein CDAR_66901 [Caerostris darwini]|uniref:Uncharacterized protein n=1 Tax=Caerostris darwini TaxID=1538125 RepID=A0AAV4QZV6_9ARAC|nr:hypothetical protein CDAR_66901 [Caerostris darwini]
MAKKPIIFLERPKNPLKNKTQQPNDSEKKSVTSTSTTITRVSPAFNPNRHPYISQKANQKEKKNAKEDLQEAPFYREASSYAGLGLI